MTMQYAFGPCTCGQTLTVDADDFEGAVQKMVAAGAAHARDVHPNENMPADQMEKNIRSMMKPA